MMFNGKTVSALANFSASGGVMLVTMSYEGISHTSKQIYDHVLKGGRVLLDGTSIAAWFPCQMMTTMLVELSSVSEDMAFFTHIDGDAEMISQVRINGIGDIMFGEY